MRNSPERQDAEFAHILYLDIVGYSQQLHEAQKRLVNSLTQMVRAIPEVQRAEADDELFIIPSGDGMALAFLRRPLAPLYCALELARTLAARSDLRLRMGIHSGPVSRITDASDKPNLTGDGINMAQRVMNCGDAGHILLSASAAEVALQFEGWRECLHDLGEGVVKHGVRLHLYSFHSRDAGNAAVPQQLLPNAQPSVSDKTVAILYKRNAPHSTHLLDVLQSGLESAGYDVFIDRHIQVGVGWAQELKRQVSNAYAVVPLLSAGNDVFALLRSWRNDRAYDPAGPWSKLTIAIAYSTEAHLFISDINQSPFNVGTLIALDDFNRVQIAEMNERYGSPLHKDAEITQLHQLLGGHPYLSRRCFDEILKRGCTLSEIAAVADRDEGPFGDHLRRLLVTLSTDAETLEVVRGLLRGEPVPDAATFYRLRSGGLLYGTSESDSRIRCSLYESYLRRRLM